jgi:hypothetical protein
VQSKKNIDQPYKNTLRTVGARPKVHRVERIVCFYMEDDAGALVRRPALKTGFSEMGWGSTPPSSAILGVCMNEDLVFRLRKRAEIRRQIPTRKSVQENAPDRIADLLEEAANRIEELESGQDGNAVDC